LSGAAQEFLDAHGGIASPGPADAASAVLLSTAGHLIALIETSLTGEQAAQLLGVDASTVRGRISRGELYAIRVGRKTGCPAGSSPPRVHCPTWLACSPRSLMTPTR